MPLDPFPAQLDANKLFAREGEINAELPLARLTRFADSLTDHKGQVTVHLNFGHDEEGRRRLRGQLSTSVAQVCQRCLQALKLELECNLDLLILASEEELEALPEATALANDVIVDDTGELDVLAIIEDELLLSLPLVPVHADESCNKVLNSLKQQVGKPEEVVKPNPFAALAELKKDVDQA